METNEEQVVPRPEGYTIVKHSPLLGVLVFLCVAVGCTHLVYLVSDDVFHFDIKGRFGDSFWWSFLCTVLKDVIPLFVAWVLTMKIIEVKVNLKITEVGLEQTRLSGSKLYPKYRMIRWEDVKHYYPDGRHLFQDFSVSVKHGVNLRISLARSPIFEKQRDNCENLSLFIDAFGKMAPQQDSHRGF